MLQIACDLFLAIAHCLRVGSPPGAYWIIYLHAPRQRRPAVDCPRSYIARRAYAILIVGPYNRAEGRTRPMCAVSKAYQARFGINAEDLDIAIRCLWCAGREAWIDRG